MADTDFGTATILTECNDTIQGVFKPEGANGFLLGINEPGSNKGCAWNPRDLQGMALSFGSTRSGKGVTSIIPALLTYAAGSMVVIDPKGENAWTTAQRRRDLGQRVVILDPWGEVNRRYAKGQPVEQVTKFNPLSALRPDDPDFADDVAAIADALIIDSGGDTHWTDSARELVAGLIAADAERHPGKASLGRVRRQIATGDAQLAEVLTVLVESNPDSLGARKLARFIDASDEIRGIRSTANTQTAILDTKRLTDAMETDDPPFDLAELATGKVTLYIVLPLDRLVTHGRWMRLILTLAIRAISRQPEPPEFPIVFLLDEFGTVGALRVT